MLLASSSLFFKFWCLFGTKPTDGITKLFPAAQGVLAGQGRTFQDSHPAAAAGAELSAGSQHTAKWGWAWGGQTQETGLTDTPLLTCIFSSISKNSAD